MTFNFNINLNVTSSNSTLDNITALLEKIMLSQADLIVQVKAATDQLVKIGTETTTLLQKITDLTAIIAAGPVTPEMQAAVDALTAQAQVVDDLVPDAPPPAPPVPPAPPIP